MTSRDFFVKTHKVNQAGSSSNEILDIDVRELIAPTKTIEEKTNQLNNISKELERSQIAIKKTPLI